MGRKAAALAVLLFAAPVAAGECREDVEERLEVLRGAVDDQIRSTEIWSYTWGSLYAAAAGTQLVFAATRGSELRSDLLVGAAFATVGSLTSFLGPLRFTVPLRGLRAGWEGSDRCALLARAEAVRTKVAKEQKFNTSWLAHGANLAMNAARGLIIGWGFGHWESALITSFIGVAVGELNLLTQPRKLDRAAEDMTMRVVPIVTRDGAGAGLVLLF